MEPTVAEKPQPRYAEYALCSHKCEVESGMGCYPRRHWGPGCRHGAGGGDTRYTGGVETSRVNLGWDTWTASRNSIEALFQDP